MRVADMQATLLLPTPPSHPTPNIPQHTSPQCHAGKNQSTNEKKKRIGVIVGSDFFRIFLWESNAQRAEMKQVMYQD